jgi:hypothetical protein
MPLIFLLILCLALACIAGWIYGEAITIAKAH